MHPARMIQTKGKEMKRFFFLSIFFWTSFFQPGLLAAADTEPSAELEARLQYTLELSDLLEYAFASNPAISASQKSWQIFIENYRIGTSYPDPRVSGTFFPRPIETRLGPQDWNLTLSQAVPFPGTLTAKGRVLAADVDISRLRVDKTVKEIVSSVSAAFYELAYIQTALEIAGANLDLNRQLLEISQHAYAGDRALFYDVSKARAQTAQIHYDILLLEELAAVEKTNINTLLNRAPDAPLGRVSGGDPRQAAYSLEEIYALALMHQEDIRMADLAVEKAEHAIVLSKYENLPSFTFGLFYAGIGEPDVMVPPRDAGEDAVGVQLGMTLPVWWGKNKSRTALAETAVEKAKAEQQVAANELKARISRMWFRLQNAGRLTTLYEKELIPQAMAALQTAETWFRQGEGGFADFLEIQATAYNFQLALARSKADYAKTLVQLEQAAGVILDIKLTGALEAEAP
jgi:outer membrane protein, heavy metal efflux system